MAKPITWESVTAPNQNGALAAAAQAGDSIRQALGGLGNTFTGYVDDTRKVATDQALAGVLNSADPLAAAAAAPQGWQIDQVALQKAALGQDQVNRGNAAQELSNEASRVSTANANAQLKDREDLRQGAVLAQPYLNQIRDRKYKGVDSSGAEWATPAGMYAQKTIQDALNVDADNRRDEERNSILRAEAEARRKDANLSKAQRSALDKAYAWSSNEGQGKPPGEVAAMYSQIAQGEGAGAAFVEQMIPQHAAATARFVPTPGQLDANVMGRTELKYYDGQATLNQWQAANQQKHAVELGAFKQDNDTAAVLANSEYAKLGASQIAEAVAAKLDKSGLFADTDANDAQQRMNAIQARAPEGVTLTPVQLAEIASQTGGPLAGQFGDALAWTDEAEKTFNRYVAFQQGGGEDGLAQRYAALQGKHKAEDAKVERVGIDFNRATRQGLELPKALLDQYDVQQEAKKKALKLEGDRTQAQADLATQTLTNAKRQEQTRAGWRVAASNPYIPGQ